MWDTVCQSIVYMIDAALAVWFMIGFLKQRTTKKRPWFSLSALAVYAVAVITAYVIPMFNAWVPIVSFAWIIAFALWYNPCVPLLKRIAAPLIFEGVVIIANAAVFAVGIYLMNMGIREAFSGIGATAHFLKLLTKCVQWMLLCMVLRLTHKTQASQSKSAYIQLLFPFVVFFELAIVIEIGLVYRISEFFGFFIAMITAIAVVIISNVGLYYLMHKVTQTDKIQSENDLYKQMLEVEKRRYEDIHTAAQQIKNVRHDMKNQLLVIDSKLQDNKIEEAKAALQELTAKTDSVGCLIQTGNRVIDFVLHAKLSAADRVGVMISGTIADFSAVSDMDLSIIIGNLIDNALEAAVKTENPHLELMFYQKGYYQNILVKNTIASPVLEENARLETTKADRTAHGYGLRSVRGVVEHYKGDLDIFEERGMFVVHIILPYTKARCP